MLIVVGIMLGGLLMGRYGPSVSSKVVQKLIVWAIWALLFLLGLSVGSNHQIMDNLGTIGLDAVLITLGAVAGSVLCAWVVYRFYFKK